MSGAWWVVRPYDAHFWSIQLLALPILPLLVPLGLRFVQGAQRWQERRP